MMANMVCAQILWDSILWRYRTSLVYSGTVVAGFEPANVVDWRDFTEFTAAAGSTLTFTVSANEPCNTLVIWPDAATTSGTVTVSWSGGSQAVNLASYTAGQQIWIDIAQFTVAASGTVVVTFSASGTFRLISLGSKLQFPIGQWNNINPPTLYQGVVVENAFSVNGSIVGRNIRRLEKAGQILLTHLDPAWVRSYWEPFITNAARRAFWYRWSPVGYPTEIALAVADQINPPINMMPPPLMQVTLQTKMITA